MIAPQTRGDAIPKLPSSIEFRDGRLIVTTSSLDVSGIYWTVDTRVAGPTLLVSDDLGALASARLDRTTLDDDYLQGFIHHEPSPDRTPYRQVHRLAPGNAAVWAWPDASPEIAELAGPGSWAGDPDLEGPDAITSYRSAFDDLVSELLFDGKPVAAMMSGGLDSTYLVATIAQFVTPDRPVHALTHVPHPRASLTPSNRLDPDESSIARAMEKRYPGRVLVIPIANEDLTTPLDAARIIGERAWVPAVNPENEVWIQQMEIRAAALGASCLFSGEQGNYAFSYQPENVLSDALASRDLAALLGAYPRERATGVNRREALRGNFGRPVERRLRRAVGRRLAELGLRERSVALVDTLVPGAVQVNPSVGHRDAYLIGLAGSDTSLGSVLSSAGRLLPIVDPFRGEEVLRIAASLTVHEWNRGPYPRGFARRVGAGRVPDEIRLRNRAGGQACDTWHAICHLKDRYIDEASAVASTPLLGEWADAQQIVRMVERWPWGQPTGPAEAELRTIHVILTLAGFIRMTQQRLMELPVRPPSGAPTL